MPPSNISLNFFIKKFFIHIGRLLIIDYDMLSILSEVSFLCSNTTLSSVRLKYSVRFSENLYWELRSASSFSNFFNNSLATDEFGNLSLKLPLYPLLLNFLVIFQIFSISVSLFIIPQNILKTTLFFKKPLNLRNCSFCLHKIFHVRTIFKFRNSFFSFQNRLCTFLISPYVFKIPIVINFFIRNKFLTSIIDWLNFFFIRYIHLTIIFFDSKYS